MMLLVVTSLIAVLLVPALLVLAWRDLFGITRRWPR